MPTARIPIAAFLCTVIAGCTTPPESAPVPLDPRVAALAFLSGTWTMVDPETGAWTEERWSEPAADGMLGTSRTVRDGRTRGYEFLRIAVDDAFVTYFASPGGRHPPTAFPATAIEPDAVRFENPAHDFPQRIEYRREEDTLRVWIDGPADGGVERIEWTFHRSD